MLGPDLLEVLEANAMTAVCIKCGEFKDDPLDPCSNCGFVPTTSINKERSVQLTDQNLSRQELEQIARSIRSKMKPHYVMRDEPKPIDPTGTINLDEQQPKHKSRILDAVSFDYSDIEKTESEKEVMPKPRRVEETPSEKPVNPDRVGLRMDVLLDIAQDLNSSIELQRIFGVPVAKGLVVVADNNDLRIEDGGRIEVSKEDAETFLRILDEIIRKYSR